MLSHNESRKANLKKHFLSQNLRTFPHLILFRLEVEPGSLGLSVYAHQQCGVPSLAGTLQIGFQFKSAEMEA